MSKTRIFSALFFTSYVLSAQPVLDSLKHELAHHTQHDSVRVALLISIAQNAWGADPPLIKQCGEEALSISRKLGYTKGVADSYREIARFFWSQTDYHKTIDFALLAMKEYEKCNNQQGIAYCYGTIGLSYAQANNYDKSVESHNRALKLNREIGYAWGIARDLNNLGYTYELQGRNKEALAYYDSALKSRMESGKRQDIMMPLNNVGGMHMTLGNFQLAEQYFLQSLAIAREMNNKNMIALVNQNLGRIGMNTKRYDDAHRYLAQALMIGKEIGDKKRLEGVYESLRDLELLQENYEAAFRYQQSFQEIRDTLYSQERTEQLARLETRFERERNEQTIKLLEQDRRIQSILKNVLLAGFLLALFILFTMYFLLRYRERKNRELFSLRIDFLTTQNRELSMKYKTTGITTDQGCIDIETQNQRILKKALEVVEAHISDPMFGVEKMAEEMYMSRASLHRKLKAASGFSPSDFIRNVRLKRAATLLSNQADSVSQIGFSVGFDDHSYFSKSFKKQFGVTPSEYSTHMEIIH
jgi:AraC-like DNA-binding protein